MFVNNCDNLWALKANLFATVTHSGCHLFFVKRVVKELPIARVMSPGVILPKL